MTDRDTPLSHEQLWAVCRRLETDYEPWGAIPDEQRGPDCSCGCRHFHPLEGRRGMDWGICGNAASPRAGLLTFEHQGGWASGLVQCFAEDPHAWDEEDALIAAEDAAADLERAQRREALAALAHEQWSGWMGYLFGQCTLHPDGRAVIPAPLVKRWQRQRATPYAKLPEEEKESDRTQADRVLQLMEGPAWPRVDP